VDALVVAAAVLCLRRRWCQRGERQGDLTDVLDAGLGVGWRHLLEAPAVAPQQLPRPARGPPPAPVLHHPQLLHRRLQALDPLVQRRRHADAAPAVDLLPPLLLIPYERERIDHHQLITQR
jgi:hypothetical protein